MAPIETSPAGTARAGFRCAGPDCRGELRPEHQSHVCAACGKTYGYYLSRPCFTAPAASERPGGPCKVTRLNRRLNKLEALYSHSFFHPSFFKNLRVDGFIKKYAPRMRGPVVEIGSGDRKRRKFFGDRYVAVDYPGTQSSLPDSALPDFWADVHHLPLADASADALCSVFMLEHVKDPARAVAEMARVLKPGGHLLLVGPGDLCMTHGDPHHFFNPTRYGYYRLFGASGLKVIEEMRPIRTVNTVLEIVFNKIVRNSFYNKNVFTKLLQVALVALSLPIVPVLALLSRLLDKLIPDDRRGYSAICFFLTKTG